MPTPENMAELQRQKSLPPKGQWVCRKCTLYNGDEVVTCVACGTNKEQKVELKGDEIKCLICWEHIPPERIRDTSCKHNFCQECWSGYLTNKIKDGQVIHIHCPHPECFREIDAGEIGECVDNDTMAKYKKFVKNGEVALDKNKRWCPTRDCNSVLAKPATGRKATCGTCNKSFCWNCNERHHKGSCERKAQSSNAAAFALYKLMNNVKPCPRCHVPIQRASGCNHMTCGTCRYEFCWMCGGKYGDNHFEWWNVFGCAGGQDGGLAFLGDDTCCCVNCDCCSCNCGCDCIGYYHFNPVGFTKRMLLRVSMLVGLAVCCPCICCYIIGEGDMEDICDAMCNCCED